MGQKRLACSPIKIHLILDHGRDPILVRQHSVLGSSLLLAHDDSKLMESREVWCLFLVYYTLLLSNWAVLTLPGTLTLLFGNVISLLVPEELGSVYIDG